MEHGKYTGMMGKRLYEKYRETVHQVFYDHGKDPREEPHYCKPTPFFGAYSSASTMSCVDVAVLNQDSSSIELIAEIEESGHEPKKIIGDIVSLLLSEKIRIGNKDYGLGKTPLVLRVLTGEKGKAREKIERIRDRLSKLCEKDASDCVNVVLVFEAELARLVDSVQANIENRLSLSTQDRRIHQNEDNDQGGGLARAKKGKIVRIAKPLI